MTNGGMTVIGVGVSATLIAALRIVAIEAGISLIVMPTVKVEPEPVPEPFMSLRAVRDHEHRPRRHWASDVVQQRHDARAREVRVKIRPQRQRGAR